MSPYKSMMSPTLPGTLNKEQVALLSEYKALSLLRGLPNAI